MTTLNTDNSAAEREALMAQPQAGRSLWADARRKIFRDRGAVLCLVIIGLYGLITLGGACYDWLAEHPQACKQMFKTTVPTFTSMKDYHNAYAPPTLKGSWLGWLGTDWSGKSVLVKTLLGAKVSFTVGLMANLIAIPLGLLLGGIAGYYGGIFDDLIVWLYSTLSSIPGFILLIAIKFAFKDVSVFGLELAGIHGLYLALGVTNWIGTCRLVRAEVMKVRELDYVLAARASGRGSFAILLRHVMPNVFHIAIINFSLGFVGAVQSEVALSYLGLGVAVGTPSWGNMINSARMDLFVGRWWELASAVSAMFFLVLSLNIFGDRLRDALDPRLKNV